MDPGLLLQYVLIALAVALSACYVAKRQWPGLVRRLRIACALPLLREGQAAWAHKVGRWIAPPVHGSGGSDSCGSSCGGCGPTPPGR
jgi:hypothetical protein